MIALQEKQTLTQALMLLPLDDLLHELIEITENATKPGELGLGLVLWCDLPDDPKTYAWASMLARKYSLDALRQTVLGLLMAGVTVEHFENTPRFLQAWITATVRNKHETPELDQTGSGVLSLDRFKVIRQETQT